MKNKLTFFLLFVSLIMSSYEANTEQKNTYNKLLELKQIDIVYLEETNYHVLERITYASVIENKLLLTDHADGTIKIFDKNTGKIIDAIKTKIEFSDSVGLSGFTPVNMDWEMEYCNTYQKDYHSAMYKDSDLKLGDFTETNTNNNIISALATLRVAANKIDENKIVLTNSPALIKYNQNYEVIDFIAFEPVKHFFPVSRDFIETDDFFYLSSIDNIRFYYENKVDSLCVLNKYDKHGNFIEVAEFLDGIYTKSEYGYKLYPLPFLCIQDNDYRLALPFSNNIRGTNFEMQLQNLPFNNDSVYQSLIDSANRKQENLDIDLNTALPVEITGIFNRNGNLVIPTFINIDEEGKEGDVFYIQEYNNKKVSHYSILPAQTDRGFIRFIHYDEIDDNFLIFRKHNQKGWTMEVMKWEE